MRRLAGGRPVLVAGSTMAGEEAAALTALAEAGGGEAALLVLAPRHPERWDEVAEQLARSGLESARRSDPEAGGRPAVLLLDSLGERGRRLVEANRGALERTLELLAPLTGGDHSP